MTLISPGKHSHPDRTVLNVAMLLLGRIRHARVEGYEELRQLARQKIVGGDVLFRPALDLLFVLGLVEYRPKTDAIEYAGPNEAV